VFSVKKNSFEILKRVCLFYQCFEGKSFCSDRLFIVGGCNILCNGYIMIEGR
jgi:hypothetical protein